MTLHILNGPDSLSRAQPAIAPGDAVLFIEAAIVDSLSRTLDALQGVQFYALTAEDNLSAQLPVSTVNYAQFVQLTVEHPHCLSW